MHAALVGSGILISRILGLVRESLKARYLGASGDVAADAFFAAFRIPNALQNLLGEGALSASLIPVYSKTMAAGDRAGADRIAGAVGALLALLSAALVLIGVLTAPLLVSLVAAGFTGERRELTILLTRIFFPGAALFVFSAWCLGILNSHKRFFLSYTAPVAWNVAMIAALVIYRDNEPTQIAVKVAWASVIGAALQFLVQLPSVLRLATDLRLSLGRGNDGVRRVMANFVPAFLGRGVVQINAFVDQTIASMLPIGAVALLGYTQTLTMLPISLFGMSIAASELPIMAGSVGSDQEIAERIRTRLTAGLRMIALLVVPSAVAFLLVGDVIAAALYRHGRFTQQDTLFAWGILGAASIGLLASTMSRLYSSAFYALHDTRTPLRVSMLRVAIASVLGWTLARYAPGALGIDARWGAAALALSSSIVGWIELTLLRQRLNARVGATGVDLRTVAVFLVSALVAGAAAFALKAGLAGVHRILLAVIVVGTFGIVYGAMTIAFRVPEVVHLTRRFLRRPPGSR